MKYLNNILEFSFIDILDVVLVAFLLYYIYKLIKGTVAINIFIGIAIIYVIWKITEILEMQLLSNILGGFISVGMFALIVVFQQEIRKFLLMIGSTNLGANRNFFKQLKFLKIENTANTDVRLILSACQKMGVTKTGAIIVLERNNSLDYLVGTGDPMNIKVTQPILESIFYKNSPLHDGAIIVEGNTIKATRVILPVNNQKTIPKRFGLRHRAAVGITERTDAIAIVVSEETGDISCFRNGDFMSFAEYDDLITKLQNDLV